MSSFHYLASPYSHPCPTTRRLRFISACRAAAKLMEQGISVFCPIAHSHPIAEEMHDRHTDHKLWMAQDIPILAHASRLIVLQLDGWRESKGMIEEIKFARDNGIPVEYLDPKKIFQMNEPESILLEAQRLVHGDRQENYGHPIDDFSRTAAMWTSILGHPITAEQVGLCMCAVKLSRQVNKPKKDNLVDLAGYAATVQMVIDERERRAAMRGPWGK